MSLVNNGDRFYLKNMYNWHAIALKTMAEITNQNESTYQNQYTDTFDSSGNISNENLLPLICKQFSFYICSFSEISLRLEKRMKK